MAEIVDAFKRKNAEKVKRCTLNKKRKLEMEHQAPIDAEREADLKRKRGEYNKQYRLKKKLEIEQRASNVQPQIKSSDELELEVERKRKKAEYDKQYRLKRKLEMEQRASSVRLQDVSSDDEYEIILNVPKRFKTYDEADAEFTRRTYKKVTCDMFL
jgi:hypothetical protein